MVTLVLAGKALASVRAGIAAALVLEAAAAVEVATVPGTEIGCCCCCLRVFLGSAGRCCSGSGWRWVARGSGVARPEGGRAVALTVGFSCGLLSGQPAARWAVRAALVGNDSLQVEQIARV